MGENREIGKDNDMPWKRGLPADLAYFKETTKGHTVVMGRKTFESIGKPLPDRQNIILSTDPTYQQPGCIVLPNIDAVKVFAQNEQNELFIIGGATIYQQFLPYANRLYITKIHQTFQADTFFPDFNEQEMKIIKEKKGVRDEKNQFDYTFLVYQTIENTPF